MNPFLFIIVALGCVGILITAYMDGAERPPQRYNLNHILISTVLHWLLVFGAVVWAQNH